MALKKSDLYASLWKSCNELRGGMDASQYKDYILTLLFVKYVSDKAKSDPAALIDIPEGGSFEDLAALDGDKEIGDKINKTIAKLAEANGLEKVIDVADFNDPQKLGEGKAMVDRLSKLVKVFAGLDFRGSRAEGDDLLGDAYEYLMRHFATESGKSKGQFYTPAEVSRVLARLLQIPADAPHSTTAYDPTCGSGSLLVKVADEAPNGLTLYGQESDNATWALARMNMILHGNEDSDVRLGNTIADPKFVSGTGVRTFDFVVANPPFSLKSWSTGLDNEYGRFDYGRPPEKNGDYAFLLHILTSLKSTGRAAVILPHGVLFRGNAESDIRRELVRRGYVKGIIGLPANLFYGTSIPACIIVLDKKDAHARKGVFMIDASKGFAKDGNKNRLRPRDMHQIVDVFTTQVEVDRYSRMVPLTEISSTENDYNLNIPRYVNSAAPEDLQDLHAHLNGGIPDRDLDLLNEYWRAFPELRADLFTDNRPGYSDLRIEVGQVQQRVLDAPEFQKFAAEARAVTSAWFASWRPRLVEIDANTKPASVIASMGDDLLARFVPVSLLDEYTAYEQLMTYWHETVHDDVLLVMGEGWLDAAKPRLAIKNQNLDETPDLAVGAGRAVRKYKMDLIPPHLVVARYFAGARARVDELSVEVETATAELEAHAEVHGEDEGLLSEVVNDKGRYTQQAVNAAVKRAKAAGDSETLTCAQEALKLVQSEAAAKKTLKEAQARLDDLTLAKYSDLTEDEVKTLVLDDKWSCTVESKVSGEVDNLVSELVSRIRQIGRRYHHTVDEISDEIRRMSSDVESNLAAMGVK